MLNSRLSESQAGIKITRRKINNLRYADDTTIMAESKKELKSLLLKVKEESEKADLKLSIQKMKVMAWTSNQSILREISPKYSLEGLMLKLKLQYFGHMI